MPDLKPCPFCGGEAELRAVDNEKINTDWYVLCLGCCVETFPSYSRKKAAESWNRRAGEPKEGNGNG